MVGVGTINVGGFVDDGWAEVLVPSNDKDIGTLF